MAVARVQFAGNSNTSGGTYTISLAATTANNLLVVCIGSYKGVDWIGLPNVMDNLSSQYKLAYDYVVTAVDRLVCYYLPNIPAGITQVIVSENQPSAAVAMEYSGLTNQIDQVGTAQTQTDVGGVVTWNAPGIRTNVAAGVMIISAVAQVSPSGFVGTGGFTLVQEQDIVSQSISQGVLDQMNAAAGVYSPGGTVNASMQVDSCCIAFK